MPKIITALLLAAPFLLRASPAAAEFGLWLAKDSVSLFFSSMEYGAGVDGCGTMLLLMLFSLIADVVWYGFLRPVIRSIRRKRYRRKMRDIDELRSMDPALDMDRLSEWVQDLYRRLQREWMDEHGLDAVSAELDEYLLDTGIRHQNKLIDKGMGRNVTGIAFHTINPNGWREKKHTVILDLELDLTRTAWLTNRRGEPLAKQEPVPERVRYVWRLERPKDMRTDPRPVICPGCGESVDALYGECPRCGKALERSPQAWKLLRIIPVQDD